MHKTEHIHSFESPSEFAEYCRVNNIHRDDGSAFTNYITPKHAMEIAISGDISFVGPAEELLAEMDLKIHTMHYMDMPSVAGCYPVVPEALAGDPECMREPVAYSDDSNPITIYVDISCSQGMQRKEMEERGAAIVAVVMALSAIRPTTLKLIQSNNAPRIDSKGNQCGIVTIDISTTPLDLATTAAMISEVGFFRQLLLGYASKWKGETANWSKFVGLHKNDGHTEEYAKNILDYLGADDNCIYISGAQSSSDIVKNPKQWVLDTLAKYHAE